MKQFSFRGTEIYEGLWQKIQWQEQKRSQIWLKKKSILLLRESRAKWTVLWWAPGDVMSSLNIQVWWWTGSFSQCLLSRLSNGLTLSFLWHKIDTKTACAFCNNPALIQINMPHEGFGLNFCISTMTTLSLPGSTYCRDDKIFHVTLPICVSDATFCVSTHAFPQLSLLLHRESDGKSQSGRREQNQ